MNKKPLLIISLSIIVCTSLILHVYSAGIFPNAPFSYGVWYSGGTPVWQNNEIANRWNVRAYNYQQEWVLSWRITNQKYAFNVNSMVSVNIWANPETQEGWFYLHTQSSVDNDPWNLGGTWQKISVARHLGFVRWIYHMTYHGEEQQGIIWEGNEERYYNGTWEIRYEWDEANSHAIFRLYFTPNDGWVQAQAELCHTWNCLGAPNVDWDYCWGLAGNEGYLYVGISYYNLYHTNYMRFANLKIGHRIF